MNNKLIDKLKPSDLVDKKLHYDICKLVSKNDISYETIINHMKAIIDNNCIGWVNYYSTTGSYIFNQILRSNKYMNNFLLEGLNKITDTMNKVELPQDYYFYRFVWDDNFIKDLKIGDYFIDKGFVSTTRDPFYSPGIKMDFGLVLIKINIPENLKGAGLLIENFSMFPKEEEFLIKPFSKLKLKARDEKTQYYHTNEKFEKLIKKKYEFDLVGSKENINININISTDTHTPERDMYKLDIDSNDRIGLFKLFQQKCDEFGFFEINYKDKQMLFCAQWFDSTGSYNHMYKNKTKDGFVITHYNNGYPIISFEMGEYLYVNYFRTISYYDNYIHFDFDYYIDLIAHFGRVFKYKEANILFNYKNFTEFKNNYKDTEFLYTKLYCDEIYQYYKNNKKSTNKYLNFNYGFWKLDKIGKTNISDNIKNKLPKEIRADMTWKELFILIVEKYFYLYKKMEEWINNEFDNLFDNIYYTFNLINYLEKQGYDVVDLPTIKHVSSFDRGEIFRTVFMDNIRRN
jgi:hypothetical protein